jgi:hypothetical protein
LLPSVLPFVSYRIMHRTRLLLHPNFDISSFPDLKTNGKFGLLANRSAGRLQTQKRRRYLPARPSLPRTPSLSVLPSRPSLAERTTFRPLPHPRRPARGLSTPYLLPPYRSSSTTHRRSSKRSSSHEGYWRSSRTRWPSVMMVSGPRLTRRTRVSHLDGHISTIRTSIHTHGLSGRPLVVES